MTAILLMLLPYLKSFGGFIAANWRATTVLLLAGAAWWYVSSLHSTVDKLTTQVADLTAREEVLQAEKSALVDALQLQSSSIQKLVDFESSIAAGLTSLHDKIGEQRKYLADRIEQVNSTPTPLSDQEAVDLIIDASRKAGDLR